MATALSTLALMMCAAGSSASQPALSNTIFFDGFDAYPLLRYSFDVDGSNTGSLPGYTMNVVDSTYVTGEIGQGVDFGTSGYANVAGMRAVMGASPEVTIAFWMYEAAQLSSQAFWDVDNRSTAPYGGVQLGQTGSYIFVCVSATRSAYVDGQCDTINAPSTGAWHHWIIRYSGTGLGLGQGGPTEIYVDDVLMLTVSDVGLDDPVFNATGMSDVMTVGGTGVVMDDLKIFNRTFTPAEQCMTIIGGSWDGASCLLP